MFCVVLILSPASTPAPLTASKCRVILTGIGVFSSTALTSFALRNIPYLLEATGKPVDEATGQHLVGLFYIAFTISRFVTILLSFRVSSSSLWFYSSLLIIPSILLLNSDTHCGATKIAVVIFGCFVGPLYPSSISSLTTSGPLSFLILALLVLITQIAESVNLFKTNSVQAVLMGLNLLCLGSAALNRLGTSCTWKPDMGIKTVP